MTGKPKPVLQHGVIYVRDNGALICVQCAGRDLSGHRVRPASMSTIRVWQSQFGEPLACEGACIVYQWLQFPLLVTAVPVPKPRLGQKEALRRAVECLRWYAAPRRPEDSLSDNGERAAAILLEIDPH